MRIGYRKDLKKVQDRLALIQKELNEVNVLVGQILEEPLLNSEPEKKVPELEQKIVTKEQKAVRL